MDNFIVVFFDYDQTYSVINDSANKFKNCKVAQVKFDDVWYSGEIVCRGTKKKCQNYIDFRLNNSKFVATDESEVENGDDELVNALKTIPSMFR